MAVAAADTGAATGAVGQVGAVAGKEAADVTVRETSETHLLLYNSHTRKNRSFFPS